MNTYSIDIFKEFKLETPMAGLVLKVIKPKGVIRHEKFGESYSLYTDDSQLTVYNGEEFDLIPGIYWVLDIFKHPKYQITQWNHYLFVVEDGGAVYPIAEYCNQHDSSWVKQALPVIKRFFAGESFNPIELTYYLHRSEKRTSWRA